jgi:hypothetical protein
MKTEELRRGNLLMGQHLCIVREIGETSVRIKGNSSYFNIIGNNPCLEPIPLTEDWLKRFGFSWYESFESWIITTGEDTQDFIIRHDFVVCDMDHRPEIKFVHQLQNLYFVLTGKELELKD